MAFELPPLPYAENALEPNIDAKTMHIHHDTHHGGYVRNLNAAVQGTDLENKSAEELISNLNQLPADKQTAVRNNGGGHVNHSMFWQIMQPNGGGEPTGPIAQAINRDFGSFQALKDAVNKAGATRFGSGWAWVVLGNDGKLHVTSTPNQDNPMMEGQKPIFGVDVWEHAYYLKYQAARAAYLEAWWNTLNWDEINKRYQAARGQ